MVTSIIHYGYHSYKPTSLTMGPHPVWPKFLSIAQINWHAYIYIYGTKRGVLNQSTWVITTGKNEARQDSMVMFTKIPKCKWIQSSWCYISPYMGTQKLKRSSTKVSRDMLNIKGKAFNICFTAYVVLWLCDGSAENLDKRESCWILNYHVVGKLNW